MSQFTKVSPADISATDTFITVSLTLRFLQLEK